MNKKDKPRRQVTKRSKPPHNAKLAEHQSFGDLLLKAANALRAAEIHGREVRITRAELLLRMSIERAISGSPRDVAEIVRRMAKNPMLAASFKTEIVTYVNGAAARL